MKPEILIIADVPGWALDRTAENVIKRLSKQFKFKKVFNNQAVEAVQKKDYDLLYITYWRQFQDATINIKINGPTITGIRSHFKWDNGKGLPPSEEMLNQINAFKTVNVPSRILYNVFTDKHPALFYTPHGVDQHIFVPAKNPFTSPAGELVIGWTGSKKNHPGKRGLDDLLIPALNNLKGVKLITAAREDKWRTQEEMVNFYQKLDVYICTSRTEGGPHPLLEASSCGIPVISTKVGIAPDLIENNKNGLLIEQSIVSIQNAVTLLRDNPDHRQNMAIHAREVIEQSWTWDIQAQHYVPFFEKGLS
jgi:glycosyltransferase involved in cell wall biosynthesis